MSDENPFNELSEGVSKEALSKAVATYKKIFNGKNIEDIEQAKTFCTSDKN
jgi:hypothetical protein